MFARPEFTTFQLSDPPGEPGFFESAVTAAPGAGDCIEKLGTAEVCVCGWGWGEEEGDGKPHVRFCERKHGKPGGFNPTGGE